MQGEKHVGIAGAGLVGSLWALYLAQRGYEVDVYEGRPDMRQMTAKGGRSINLALSDRGWRALNRINMKHKVEDMGIPMYGRMVHDENGSTQFRPYGTDENQAIYSVSRANLNRLLMDEAEAHNGVNLYFDQKAEQAKLSEKRMTFTDRASGQQYTAQYDTLFGTDGAFSKVRESMMKTKRFNYSQSYLDHAYKELTIPADSQGQHQLYKNALHIWPRNSFMLIALPNPDGSFTCTLFLAFEGNPAFEQLETEADIHQFFDEYFPDAKVLMPDLADEFLSNPTDALLTIRCDPWHYEDKACLLGDSAHAIVPFYGQGMNAGFEDCMVMDELMDHYQGADWGTLFKAFSERRVKDGHAIADLALFNFIEMRDLVADPHFHKKEHISALIHELAPDQWLPLYTMVTFSELPYSEAKRRGDEQDEILEKLLQHYDYEDLCRPEVLKDAIQPYVAVAEEAR